MDQPDLAERLADIIGDICPDLDPSTLDRELPLVKQGMDSLDVVDFVLRIETDLGVKVENDEFDSHHLGILSNMIVYLRERLPG